MIKELIKKGETVDQAFFDTIDNTNDIIKTVTAFANTNGGTFLIGVKLNAKIVGVFPEEELHKFEVLLSQQADTIKFSSEVIQEKFRMILLIRVEESQEKPVKTVNKEIYIRSGNKNIKANKIQELVWKYRDKNGSQPDLLASDELDIFEIIKDNPRISLTQLYKQSHLEMNKVDFFLTRLVGWGIVKMDLSELGSFFNTCESISKERY